jgi:CRP/FNR family transcriptional regulator, cyclic AMP receptor protein
MSEKIWFIKKCDLFARLTPPEMEHLERQASVRTFKRREIIYFPTEPGQSVLLVARGRVKLKDISPDGKETILAFIDEGEIFGELAIVDVASRNEFAEAVEDSQILAFARSAILGLMERRADVAMHITKLVGLRRRRLENRLRNILFRSNRERVAHILLELVDSHGQRRNDGWEIEMRLTHQDLASLIGATRETVTIVLGQLQADRMIQVRRRQITIMNLDRLQAEANHGLAPIPVSMAGPVPSKGKRKWP